MDNWPILSFVHLLDTVAKFLDFETCLSSQLLQFDGQFILVFGLVRLSRMRMSIDSFFARNEPGGNMFLVEQFLRSFRLVQGQFQRGDLLFRWEELLLKIVRLSREIIFVLAKNDDLLSRLGELQQRRSSLMTWLKKTRIWLDEEDGLSLCLAFESAIDLASSVGRVRRAVVRIDLVPWRRRKVSFSSSTADLRFDSIVVLFLEVELFGEIFIFVQFRRCLL